MTRQGAQERAAGALTGWPVAWGSKMVNGTQRLDVSLPNAGFAAVISVGYYVIGRIQEAFPDWFLEHAPEYERLQKELFAKYE